MFFTVRASSLGQSNEDEDHFFRFLVVCQLESDWHWQQRYWQVLQMMAAPYVAYFVGILATAIVSLIVYVLMKLMVLISGSVAGRSRQPNPCFTKPQIFLLLCWVPSAVSLMSGESMINLKGLNLLFLFFFRTNTLTIFSAIILFGTLVIIGEWFSSWVSGITSWNSGWTMMILYKILSVHKSQRPAWTQDLNLPIRVMAFGIYIIIAMRSV